MLQQTQHKICLRTRRGGAIHKYLQTVLQSETSTVFLCYVGSLRQK